MKDERVFFFFCYEKGCSKKDCPNLQNNKRKMVFNASITKYGYDDSSFILASLSSICNLDA